MAHRRHGRVVGVRAVGRYTHRIAITNHRLLDMDNGQVRFTDTDDRAHTAAPPIKTMPLAASEFTRRFWLHVLPTGFHRIRSSRFLGARHRRETLARCRALVGSAPSASPTATDARDGVDAHTGLPLRRCPACQHGQMTVVERLAPLAQTRGLTPDTS